MKKTLLASAFLFVMLINPSGFSQEKHAPVFIEIDGSQEKAIKLLKAGGFKAKDGTTSSQKFQIPNVTIGGNNDPFDYGEIVILSADFDSENMPEGLVEVKFKWTVLDNGLQKKVIVIDDGKQIIFAAGMKSRKIIAILDVNCLFETKQTMKVLGADGKTQEDKLVITDASAISPQPIFSTIIVGTQPQPDPTPTPVPVPTPTPVPPPAPTPVPVPVPPAPVLPDGQFGLAPFAYQSFMADTNLDMPSKVKLANSLADNLTGIASQIAAIPTYNDISIILADTKKGNDAAFASLGLDMSKTVNLQSAFRTKIYALYAAQKINTASDLSIAWQELSQGLRQVK